MERVTRKRVDVDKYNQDTPPDGDPPAAATDEVFVFQTEWANYYFHPGNHSTTTQLPTSVIRAMDAIVVEKGFKPYERCSFDDIAGYEQYEKLIETNLEAHTRCPVYSLDLPLNSVPQDREESKRLLRYINTEISLMYILPVILFLSGLAVYPPSAIFILPFLLPAIVAVATQLGWEFRMGTYFLLTAAPTSFAYRSAVVARKLERFVAPKLARDRKRRVNILVDFGALHIDIGMYLRHPHLRRFNRWLHQYRETRVDKEYFNNVLEFSFGDTDPMYASRSKNHNLKYKKLIYTYVD